MTLSNSRPFPFKSPADLNDFVVIDLETTGRDPRTCEIIQLSAVRYQDHVESSYFSTYVDPRCHIPQDATRVNGITDSMVEGAPHIEDVLGEFVAYVLGSSYVTGYNVGFDLAFIDAAAGSPISEHFVWFDTMTLVRRIMNLPRYRLIDVCEYIGYDTCFHDSLCDCRACGEALNYLCRENRMDHALHSKSERVSALSSYMQRTSSGTCPVRPDSVQRGGVFEGKSIVFTGALSFSRSAAKDLAQRAGASVKTGVSKKTDFLVVGQQDEILVGCDGMSDKEEKAHALISAGFDIKIIDESTFLSALSKSEELGHGSANLV